MNYEKLRATYKNAYRRICKRFPKLSRLEFNTYNGLSSDEKKVVDRLDDLGYMDCWFDEKAEDAIMRPEVGTPWDVALKEWAQQGQDMTQRLCKFCNTEKFIRLEHFSPCVSCPFARKGVIRPMRDVLAINAASELGCVFVPLGEESPFAVPDIPDIPCVPDDTVNYTEYI